MVKVCREVLWRSVVEKWCCKGVLWRSVIEKCCGKRYREVM